MTPPPWARLWRRFSSASIQVKAVGLTAGLVLLLGLGAIVQARASLTATIGVELNKRGVSLAQDLAARIADPLLTRDHLKVFEILQDTSKHNVDVRYVFVQDGAGRLVAHTFIGGFPGDLLRTLPASQDLDLPVQRLQTEEGPIREAAAPVYTPDIGTVRVGMSEAGLAREVVRVERTLLAAIVIMALLATFVAWQITRLFTRPIVSLVGIARTVARGDLSGRAEATFEDEAGELVLAFNLMLDSLQESRSHLEAHVRARTELVDRTMTAQEDERKRIARELHDDTGQAITGLMVGLKVLEQFADDPDEVRERCAELRVLAARTLESVRQLSRQLRPSVLDDAGLVAALRRFITDLSRHNGLAVDLQVVGDESRRLPTGVETAAYRIVQEALMNVLRHARARGASVVLDLSGTTVTAVVEDDGIGFDPAGVEEASGLLGMRERATLLGGSLTIESQPGAGSTVFAKLPTVEVMPHAYSHRG